MIFLLEIIPIIICLIGIMFFPGLFPWWESIIIILPPLLYIPLKKSFIIDNIGETDYYKGNIVVKAIDYNAWDEIVPRYEKIKINTGEVDNNGDFIFKYRDVLVNEVVYHRQKYVLELLHGDEIEVPYYKYKKVCDTFGTGEVFKNLYRNYYSINGNCFITEWNGMPERSVTYTSTETYKNYVYTSNSIFREKEITKKEAKKNGLFNYPSIIDDDQKTVLGKTITSKEEQLIKYINGNQGVRRNFRIYILFFNDKDIKIAQKQKNYWKGGNPNEVVVCIGLKNKKFNWCDVFSWSEKPVVETAIKDYFVSKKDVDLVKFGNWLNNNLHGWRARDMNDFNYLKPKLTIGEVCKIAFKVLEYSIILSIITSALIFLIKFMI